MSSKPAPRLSAPPVANVGPRITIADVARAAGVSKATVSRFLNRRDKLLTPRNREARRVGHHRARLLPSPMAQALKRGHSQLIGLVVADITNPFSVAVLRGAEKACQEAGYLVMLFNLGATRASASAKDRGAGCPTRSRASSSTRWAATRGGLARWRASGKPAVLVDRQHRGHAGRLRLARQRRRRPAGGSITCSARLSRTAVRHRADRRA